VEPVADGDVPAARDRAAAALSVLRRVPLLTDFAV
jgi:hypothetical protein